MKYKTVLFDFDGVIIDSRPSMEIGWQKVRNSLGIDIPFELFLERIGKPFPAILNELGLPADQFANAQSIYGEAAAKSMNLIAPYKGIISALKLLRQKGMPIAIVTSKEFWRADLLLDKLQIHVDLLITPEFTDMGKPNPEPLLKALEILGGNTGDSVYIGDMISDYQAALNASMDYLHADWGYGESPPKALTLSCPDELIEIIT